MTDLLPCPFCGSSNLRYEFCGSQGYIECNECGTQGPCDERAADPICDPGAACDAWNRRAALAQPESQGPTNAELKATMLQAIKDFPPSHPDAKPLSEFKYELELEYRKARAVLARWGRPAIEPDGPAVPDGREPASVTDQPTDKELLALMPETMRDEFSYAARVCSDATGGQVKPGIFRVALNTAALEYARAVLGAAHPCLSGRSSDD